MVGEPSKDYSILVTKQMVFRYNKNGDLNVHNITSAKLNPNINEYSKINSVVYKPYYPQTESNEVSNLDIIESTSDAGNIVLLRVPGTKSKLLFMEVVNNEIIPEGLMVTVMKNKTFMFISWLFLVLGYQFFRKKGVFKSKIHQSHKETTKQKESINPTLEKLSQFNDDKYLEAIAQRLKGLDDTAERLTKFTEDSSDLRSAARNLNPNRDKYKNKVDFLDNDD